MEWLTNLFKKENETTQAVMEPSAAAAAPTPAAPVAPLTQTAGKRHRKRHTKKQHRRKRHTRSARK